MSRRARTIKPGLLEDIKTASLDDSEFRLFVSILLLADDYGVFRAIPAWISGQVYWAKGDRIEQIAIGLQKLLEVGLITLYDHAGQPYGHITGWDKHQKIDHPGKQQLPLPCDADLFAGETLGKVPRPSRDSRETLARLSEVGRDPRETFALDRIGEERRGEECGVEDGPKVSNQPPPTLEPPEPSKPRASKTQEVFDYWREKLHPNAKLDSKRSSVIAKALKSYSVEELKLAVDGTMLDPWRMGENPERKRYTGIDLIFRSAEKIDPMIELARNGGGNDSPNEWVESYEVPFDDPPGTEYIPPPPEFLEALNAPGPFDALGFAGMANAETQTGQEQTFNPPLLPQDAGTQDGAVLRKREASSQRVGNG